MVNLKDKRVVIGVGAAAGITAVWMFVSMFLAPVRELEKQLEIAESKVESAEMRELEIAKAEKKLKDWRATSLPADLLVAQAEYMKWIDKLARASGFQADDSLVVKPGSKPSMRGVSATVHVDVEAKANFAAVTRFLYAFHRTDLAQRITSMDLVSASRQGDPILTVKLQAEGLVIDGADERTTLFPASNIGEDIDADVVTLEVADASSFPAKPPFAVRINDELMYVTDVEGEQLTVERGWSGSQAMSHAAESSVELLPLRNIEATLMGGLDEQANEIKVAAVQGMPVQPGFIVQVDDERMLVTSVAADKWTVMRGHDGTQPVKHKPGSALQLAYSLDDYYDLLVANSPFVKPDPERVFEPKLVADHQTINKGDSLDYAVKLTDFNADLGDVLYRLTEGAPTGMVIDGETGKVSWPTDEQIEPKDYEVTVEALQAGAAEPVATAALRVTVADPNEPPVLTIPENLELYPGTKLAFSVSATEPEGDNVQFSVDGTVPPGFEIDPATGQCQWVTTADTIPGDYEIAVVATDDGEPAQSDRKVATIRVHEDPARYTVLVACINRDGRREVWLFDRFNNRRFELQEGEEVQIAGVRAKLDEVGYDFAVFETADARLRLEIGKDLRSMETLTDDSKQNSYDPQSE